MLTELDPWLHALVERMTLAEKIGQMTQAEKGSISPDEVTTHLIGSVLSGGGGNPAQNDPEGWAAMVESFVSASASTRLGIPLLYGVDAIHGHSNLRGAVLFPHNIGLGATRDEDLVERAATITALEVAATGARWVFAPIVAVPQDLRWGRTYEGYGSDPDLVARMGAAHVRGLQRGVGALGLADGRSVLACPKHFVGDGGAVWGTAHPYEWAHWWDGWPSNWKIDQGITDVDEETLRSIHLVPYRAAIEAGALSIMVSYTTWAGLKMHANRYLLTDVLKGELGFEGFLVSDWMAIDQIDPDYDVCVETAINAGLDMIMVPIDFRRFIATATALVEAGRIPMERIDDAVARILGVKAALGLFDGVGIGASPIADIGSEERREVAREAVRKSAVLLENSGILPLGSPPSLLVAGQAADDLGLQCGGWSIEWQGKTGALTDGTTLLDALKGRLDGTTEIVFDADGRLEDRAEVGIVVLAEPPYAEGVGDRADLRLSEDDAALFDRVRARCDRVVLVLYSGRPLVMTEQIQAADAMVAAWLPGTEGDGLADILLGSHPFSGTLPQSWPRGNEQAERAIRDADPLYPFGHGLTT